MIVAPVLNSFKCSAFKFLNKFLAIPWINFDQLTTQNDIDSLATHAEGFLFSLYFAESYWFHLYGFFVLQYIRLWSHMHRQYPLLCYLLQLFALSTSDLGEDASLPNFGTLLLFLQLFNMMEWIMFNNSKINHKYNSVPRINDKMAEA